MWALRLDGLPSSISADVLKSAMETFGEVVHVNHSKFSSESIVLFSSQEAAESANSKLSEDGFQSIPGVHEILETRKNSTKHGVYCHMGHSIGSPTSESGDVGGYEGHYWPNLENLLECMEGVFEDAAFLQEAKEDLVALKAQDANQQKVGSVLLELGGRIRNDGRAVADAAALDVWLATMKLFADGELTQHCDRFADTSINELLGCLDDNCGSLSDAWVETE
jgi:hypothetical protein